MICKVVWCEKPVKHKANGLCGAHQHRLVRYGSAEYSPPPRQVSLCSVDGCDKKVAGNMMCVQHYKRFRVYGDPLAGGINKGEAKKFVLDLLSAPPVDDCITWPYGKTKDGYGRINWEGTPSNVHAIVTELKRGPRPTPKHESCHECGNGHLSCVNPEHLYWGTRKENVADAIRHGTAYLLKDVVRYGETAASAKYSDAMVGELRRRIAGGERQIDLAKEFGISKTHVNRIWKGTSRNRPSSGANDNIERRAA